MVLRLNYLTSASLDEVSAGGWDPLSAAIRAQLARRYDVRYTGPLLPRMDAAGRALFTVMDVVGISSSSHLYSPRRLQAISREYLRVASLDADVDFFHGITPWIGCRPARRYYAYVDVAFLTRVELDARLRFSAEDIARIAGAEARWMKRAAAILFSSRWALDAATRAYKLSAHNLVMVGRDDRDENVLARRGQPRSAAYVPPSSWRDVGDRIAAVIAGTAGSRTQLDESGIRSSGTGGDLGTA